jgi:hypothetical protein
MPNQLLRWTIGKRFAKRALSSHFFNVGVGTRPTSSHLYVPIVCPLIGFRCKIEADGCCRSEIGGRLREATWLVTPKATFHAKQLQ